MKTSSKLCIAALIGTALGSTVTEVCYLFLIVLLICWINYVFQRQVETLARICQGVNFTSICEDFTTAFPSDTCVSFTGPLQRPAQSFEIFLPGISCALYTSVLLNFIPLA